MPQGAANASKLIAIVEDPTSGLPADAIPALQTLIAALAHLEAEIKELDAQMERLRPFFPKIHGKPRVDDHRVFSGIMLININVLRWCGAPKEYGPAKTFYNIWNRWSNRSVFARIMVGLDAESAEHKTNMIDATCLKAHRAAASSGWGPRRRWASDP